MLLGSNKNLSISFSTYFAIFHHILSFCVFFLSFLTFPSIIDLILVFYGWLGDCPGIIPHHNLSVNYGFHLVPYRWFFLERKWLGFSKYFLYDSTLEELKRLDLAMAMDLPLKHPFQQDYVLVGHNSHEILSFWQKQFMRWTLVYFGNFWELIEVRNYGEFQENLKGIVIVRTFIKQQGMFVCHQMQTYIACC